MYFQVHQPHRLVKFNVFDIDTNKSYFDYERNRDICKRIALNCYLPANEALLRVIKESGNKFKVAFSISGTALEQFEDFAPEVIDSFKKLADTGCVEFLAETYYHSLSYIFSKEEFKEQVVLHEKKIYELFGQKPVVFRNTELVMNNEMAGFVEEMGYKGMLAEGADHLLGWRNPNFVYRTVSNGKSGVLLRNYKLSDDIAFRFSDEGWKEFPLTAEKYAGWIDGLKSNGEIVNIFMDYETFGEHHSPEKGIFDFLEKFPLKVIEDGNEFVTPGGAFDNCTAKGEVDMHDFVSWADNERDLSAWMGNPMQNNSLTEIFGMEEAIKKSKDKELLQDWRWLTISDHFYYMSTKWFSDGAIHNIFNPFGSPYEAFVAYMNVLNDIILRINKASGKVKISETPSVTVFRKGQK